MLPRIRYAARALALACSANRSRTVSLLPPPLPAAAGRALHLGRLEAGPAAAGSALIPPGESSALRAKAAECALAGGTPSAVAALPPRTVRRGWHANWGGHHGGCNRRALVVSISSKALCK